MAQPLGTTTLQTATGRILSTLNIDNPDSQMKEKIRNEINLQVAEMSKGIERFMVEVVATFINNLFNLKSISDYNLFAFLREATFGDIVKVPVDKLEKAFGILYYDNAYLCTVYGDTLKLYTGGNLSTAGRAFYVKYYRLTIPVVAPTDIIDLPDDNIETLINNVVTKLGGTQDKAPKAK